MSWECRLIEDTETARILLRRYANAPCSANPFGMSIHDARNPIGVTPVVIINPKRRTWDIEMAEPPHTDSRWPTHCACGYAFQESDEWDVSKDRLYTVPGADVPIILREAEPGMLWRAYWLEEFWTGPDGHCYIVRLPNGGDWVIDGPSTNGPGWARVGVAPRFTAQPSILAHGIPGRQGYHGWLTDGILTDDIEGRTYPCTHHSRG